MEETEKAAAKGQKNPGLDDAETGVNVATAQKPCAGYLGNSVKAERQEAIELLHLGAGQGDALGL